jgi:hypothetical protein
VLSRSADPTVPAGASVLQGDVRTGAGLKIAVENVDAVVHAATNPFRRARSTEVEGTRNVRDATVAAGTSHLLYVSIVGVDRLTVPYYKAKFAAEEIVELACPRREWFSAWLQVHRLRMDAVPLALWPRLIRRSRTIIDRLGRRLERRSERPSRVVLSSVLSVPGRALSDQLRLVRVSVMPGSVAELRGCHAVARRFSTIGEHLVSPGAAWRMS